jgi:HK97 gp10 family phage protein
MSTPVGTVGITNLNELYKKFDELSSAVQTEGMKSALLAGAFELEAEIKINIEGEGLVDTGNLMKSVQPGTLMIFQGSGEITVGTNVVYAAIHEFGGIIRARKAKALRFKTKDGKWHTVKSVTMPARPYMRPAIDLGKARILRAMSIALKASIEGSTI